MSVRTEIKWNRYGKWTALWEWYLKPLPCWRKQCYELCQCECWAIQYVRRDILFRWKSKWCKKCLYKSEEYRVKLSKANSKPKTHWMSDTAFYKKYSSILNRCNNKNAEAYKDYWARWIKCLWKSFEEFRDDMYESYLEHCKRYWARESTIDRIDVNWDYCKDNCKWSTYKEQNKNKRNLLSYCYKWNEYNNLLELCDKLKLNYAMIWNRLNKWWSIEKAIETPKR